MEILLCRRPFVIGKDASRKRLQERSEQNMQEIYIEHELSPVAAKRRETMLRLKKETMSRFYLIHQIQTENSLPILQIDKCIPFRDIITNAKRDTNSCSELVNYYTLIY